MSLFSVCWKVCLENDSMFLLVRGEILFIGLGEYFTEVVLQM